MGWLFAIVEGIRFLLSLYVLLLAIHIILAYFATSQRPWTVFLARLCEPGIRIGNQIAAKILPAGRLRGERGAVVAIVLCLVLRLVLALLFLL